MTILNLFNSNIRRNFYIDPTNGRKGWWNEISINIDKYSRSILFLENNMFSSTILNLFNNIRRNFIDLHRSSTNRRKGWWNEISINIDKYSLRSILFLFLRIIYFSQRQLWICLTEKSWEIRLIEGKEKNSSSILENNIFFSMTTLNLFNWKKFRNPINRRKRKRWWNEISTNIDKYSRSIFFLFLRTIYIFLNVNFESV